MTRDATRIAFDGTELLVAAGAVEARRLDAHRVDIGARRPKAPRFVLDRLDQLRPVALSTQPLLQPEELYEQDRGPDFAHDAADDLVTLTQGHGKALVLLLPHLLGVVADQAVEHRLLCLPDGALDSKCRHGLAQRNVDRGLRKLGVEAALVELRHQRPLQFVALVEEGDAEGKSDIAENFGVFGPGDHRARAHYR